MNTTTMVGAHFIPGSKILALYPGEKDRLIDPKKLPYFSSTKNIEKTETQNRFGQSKGNKK